MLFNSLLGLSHITRCLFFRKKSVAAIVIHVKKELLVAVIIPPNMAPLWLIRCEEEEFEQYSACGIISDKPPKWVFVLQVHVGPMRSTSIGWMKLKSANPLDHPILQPNYLSTGKILSLNCQVPNPSRFLRTSLCLLREYPFWNIISLLIQYESCQSALLRSGCTLTLLFEGWAPI